MYEAAKIPHSIAQKVVKSKAVIILIRVLNFSYLI